MGRGSVQYGKGVNVRLGKAIAAAIASHAAIADAHHSPTLLTIAETQVFAGTPPMVWTTLDLSGVIGVNPAFVLLKIACTGAAEYNYFGVRRNGDTDEFFLNAEKASGCAFGQSDTATGHIVLLVATDNNGVIQWKAVDTKDCTIDIMAYIK